MKTIYILLTRSGSVMSRVVQAFTLVPYTHCSVSFEQGLQPLYSSARKNSDTILPSGPCREVFDRGFYCRHRDMPCAVYALQVSETDYAAALERARFLTENNEDYHYNYWGAVLCRLGIPYHPRNKFFCSQFVAEVLRVGGVRLPKDSSLMMPMDYTRLPELECLYRGRLDELVSIPDAPQKTFRFFGKEMRFPIGKIRKLWYTMR